MATNSYRVERLPNGYVRVDDHASGLTGLFNVDGSYHSGALHALTDDVHERIVAHALWERPVDGGTTRVSMYPRNVPTIDQGLMVHITAHDETACYAATAQTVNLTAVLSLEPDAAIELGKALHDAGYRAKQYREEIRQR